jgi:hypothetical protein
VHVNTIKASAPSNGGTAHENQLRMQHKPFYAPFITNASLIIAYTDLPSSSALSSSSFLVLVDDPNVQVPVSAG